MKDKVILLTAEDGLEDTVKPRLDKLGANTDKIIALSVLKDENDEEHSLSLQKHIPVIEKIMEEDEDIGMVIIDPFSSFAPNLDTGSDNKVRAVLTPLNRIAEKYGVAVILIRHLTKSDRSKAMYRGLGSIAFTAMARVTLLVGRNPNNPDERIVTLSKFNLTAALPAVGFTITEDPIDGEGVFKWLEGADAQRIKNLKPQHLITTEDSGEQMTALDEAKEFLQEYLADGAMKTWDIQTQAREAMIADKTLGDAKRALGIVHGKIINQTFWALEREHINVRRKEVDEKVKEAKTPNFANYANENDGKDSKVEIIQRELKVEYLGGFIGPLVPTDFVCVGI